jgi:hypothetical protein
MRLILSAAVLTIGLVPTLVLAQAPQAPGTPAPSAAAPASTHGAGRGPQSPEAQARMEAFRKICGVDLKTHCGDVQRGTEDGRSAFRQCIDTHKAKFSTACQAAIAERDVAREARKQQTTPATEKPKS